MIQVGQVLDKYELLERVGQGGMAVVYRGLDRSLKRVVAVKVLHKHLSDYQEARDRFEREAQAVAKLRHENILEIFDYSGAEAAEQLGSSFIVTEFIDGDTLKQVFTDRPIGFPEVGAMIILQVCRALAHAHSVGILHRDVKPENIMIRGDGVVKLMDFGISHMVDLERLTVTGQLLGSPAYMAPEHVEGRQLDFRTDVFAVGIVLYQLTVGKLPFEGKNPHEVLKRIAECRFVDPRQVNARIGNRLGRIILKAMAAQPDDRFASVVEMVMALEAYLEESGLPHDKVAAELGRYFQAPGAYELALEERLIDHLTRRGQKLLAEDNRAGALDIFDRVLTIDADNEKVIAILDGINRRTRMKAAAAGIAMAAVIGAGAYMIHRRSLPPELEQPAGIGGGTSAHRIRSTQIAQEDPPPIPAPVVTPPGDAGDSGEPTSEIPGGRPAVTPIDAATVVTLPSQFRVFPEKDAEYQIEKLGWRPVPDGGLVAFELSEQVTIQIRNRSGCCQDETIKLKPGDDLRVTTHFLPARITATCSNPTVSLSINGKPWRLAVGKDIPVDGSVDGSAKVTIQFLGDNIDSTPIVERVKFANQKEVQCVPR